MMLEGRNISFSGSHVLSATDLLPLVQGDSTQVSSPPETIATPQIIQTPKLPLRNYTAVKTDSLVRKAAVLPADTITTRYHQYNYPFSSPLPVVLKNTDNFLMNIPAKTYIQPQQAFTDTTRYSKPDFVAIHSTIKQTLPANNNFQGSVKAETGMNWLVITLLVSLFTFSWLKLVYEKFIVQIVGAMVNYQVSLRLFRERNVLFKNISLGLNFTFALNCGLFIFYVVDLFRMEQVLPYKFLSMLVYTLGIALIYSIKSGVCKFLGYVFLVKDEFDEYIHNVRVYNKNIGLFLFPVIIVYPFIIGPAKPYVIYAGFLIIGTLILLRIHRGFQIIMKKGVSIFYLILYLCAIEILPVLLLIKLAASLI